MNLLIYPYYDDLFLVLLIIQFIVFVTWICFLIYSIKLIKVVPRLSSSKNIKNTYSQLVSIILPARNEEKYIRKCLDSLVKQEYGNYEIVIINDSSSDNTGQIIKEYVNKNGCKIISIESKPRPPGWTGKNWACYQGYLHSRGDLFLFTDADTLHSPTIISLAVGYVLSKSLDSLTVMPKILSNDFWTRITLPLLWTFSLARFSALKANDPKTKIGYFFGSFFIIKRNVYEMVGTHKSVKAEIVEDGELGKKVKENGYSLQVIHGEDLISAIWARDSSSLWHGLKRLLIPMYKKEKVKSIILVALTFVLLLFPLVMVAFSSLLAINEKPVMLNLALLSITIVSVLLLILSSILQLKYTLFENPLYSLAFPLAGSFLFIAFVSSIIFSGKKNTIEWRGRKYSIENK
jgi:glycosyltransferase involved in cell wall biosynthesis